MQQPNNNNPNFFTNIILGGSSAFGEAHIKKDFYTSNLTNLIEITAKNVKLVYSFSGSLKLQKLKNLLKKIFASNTKSKSLKNISKQHGIIIQDLAIVSSQVQINNGVKIHIGCQIHHEVKIGKYSTISPASIILGNVKIGKRVILGSQSFISNNIKIKFARYF